MNEQPIDNLFTILSSNPKTLAKIKKIDNPADFVGFIGRRCIPLESEDHPYANVTRALVLHSVSDVKWSDLLARLKAA